MPLHVEFLPVATDDVSGGGWSPTGVPPEPREKASLQAKLLRLQTALETSLVRDGSSAAGDVSFTRIERTLPKARFDIAGAISRMSLQQIFALTQDREVAEEIKSEPTKTFWHGMVYCKCCDSFAPAFSFRCIACHGMEYLPHWRLALPEEP